MTFSGCLRPLMYGDTHVSEMATPGSRIVARVAAAIHFLACFMVEYSLWALFQEPI
jgi:hypothetical protein